MNASEVITRLTILEQKVEKLTPAISYEGLSIGAEVAGINTALGIQLMGLTTAQRVSLGVQLAALPTIKHILVFDTEDLSFYTWSGAEWV